MTGVLCLHLVLVLVLVLVFWFSPAAEAVLIGLTDLRTEIGNRSAGGWSFCILAMDYATAE